MIGRSSTVLNSMAAPSLCNPIRPGICSHSDGFVLNQPVDLERQVSTIESNAISIPFTQRLLVGLVRLDGPSALRSFLGRPSSGRRRCSRCPRHSGSATAPRSNSARRCAPLDSKEHPAVPGALLRVESPLHDELVVLVLQFGLEIPDRPAVADENPVANRPRLRGVGRLVLEERRPAGEIRPVEEA